MIPKWGFGSAPLKPETQTKYRKSLKIILAYINNPIATYEINILDDISMVKGLFNRIIKQDQWDWFTVYMYFDYPNYFENKEFVRLLAGLRTCIKNNNLDEIKRIKNKLLQTNICVYINNFLNFDIHNEDNDEYIYILSRREDKELLKIGMTKRNVLKRVQEINSATGVVYPISPRAVFRVKDCKLAEKMIHKELSQYRLRSDREFFQIPYKNATEIIEKCLKDNDLLYYKY
ncbi:T5orf172 domain-containing protein [Ruminococcus sp. YE71]|uniref:GIY-YIG nuclease family protein n=1 Tax=unclassified Ruminococcus TaxID=2608920 RepID=UPI000882D651|nr:MULTISPECIES: GIY-YIG nuclease family protein [unclassified Ruminococcus]SDA22930.1 T5orf172 domain-containing protein [Ruminococcus sp. YE78]SFW38995.1 T5orf172 domain-containing protein [Ruminococcus sp. YE71]